MEYTHRPVLLDECIEGLNIRPDGIYLDGTLGRAGHSREIAKRLTTGRLICVDRDDAALEAAQTRLADYMDRVTLVHSNFDKVSDILDDLGLKGIDGMLFDESDTNSRDHSDLPEKARIVYYPWQDVLASMYVYPDEVHIVRTTCPECGKKYAQLHFSSPSWTWRALCGRAGTMTICPSCLKQESFILEIMN